MEKPQSVIQHTVLICLRSKRACTCTKIDLFNLIFHIQFSCSFDWVRCRFIRKPFRVIPFHGFDLIFFGATILWKNYIFLVFFSLRLLIPLGKAMPIVLHINFVRFWTKNSSKTLFLWTKLCIFFVIIAWILYHKQHTI